MYEVSAFSLLAQPIILSFQDMTQYKNRIK